MRRRALLAASASGGGGGNLITFTINGIEATAEKGMTFLEWILSDYFDVANLYWLSGPDGTGNIREFILNYGITDFEIILSSGFSFEPKIYTTDVIVPGRVYAPMSVTNPWD